MFTAAIGPISYDNQGLTQTQFLNMAVKHSEKDT